MSIDVDTYRLLIADVYELAGLSRSTSERIARAQGHSVARWHVLSVLSEDPMTCSAAARRLGLARQSVQRVVDVMVGEGLLQSSFNEADRRAPLLQLTKEGHRVSNNMFSASEATRRRQLEAVSVEEGDMRQARKVIRSLITALQKDAV